MAQTDSPTDSSLPRYREYLLLLARTHMADGLRGKVDPSDVVQEAMLKAHKAIAQFRGQNEQQLAAWLRGILANTMANTVRTVQRQGGKIERSLNAALEQSSARLEQWLA
ncbi:MAG: sigma factor, partial [Candidatus Acidiferrum sp.]